MKTECFSQVAIGNRGTTLSAGMDSSGKRSRTLAWRTIGGVLFLVVSCERGAGFGGSAASRTQHNYDLCAQDMAKRKQNSDNLYRVPPRWRSA
jgi:hypothetical protein